MLTPIIRAVDQLDDPVFLGVVWRSVLLAAVAFATLAASLAWGFAHMFPREGWLATWLPGWLGQWTLGLLGSFGAAILTVWLFVPVVVALTTLFVDRIAAAVDRRHFPGLPPPGTAAPLAVQAWDGLALGGQVLLLQGAALLLTVLLPGPGFFLGWAISGWAIGRGLFVAVAMRRMTRASALALYGRSRLPIVLQGIGLALAASIPILNLMVPVVGTAVMVHLLNPRLASPGTPGHGRR